MKNLILFILFITTISFAYSEVSLEWDGKINIASVFTNNKKQQQYKTTFSAGKTSKVEGASVNIIGCKLGAYCNIDVNKVGINKVNFGLLTDSGTNNKKTEFCPYTKLKFSWGGYLAFGAIKGAIHKIKSAANVTGGTGGISGFGSFFIPFNRNVDWQSPGRGGTKPSVNGNDKYANKVRFGLPYVRISDSLNGHFFVSYSPNTKIKGRGITPVNSNQLGMVRSMWNFVGDISYMDDFILSLSLSSGETLSKQQYSNNRVVDFKDLSSWRVGGVWMSGPISIGAEYFNNQNSGVRVSRFEGSTSGEGFDVGCAYKVGDHTVSLSILLSHRKLGKYRADGDQVWSAAGAGGVLPAVAGMPAIAAHNNGYDMGSAKKQMLSLTWDYSLVSSGIQGVSCYAEINFIDHKMSETDKNKILSTIRSYLINDTGSDETLSADISDILPVKSTNILVGIKVSF